MSLAEQRFNSGDTTPTEPRRPLNRSRVVPFRVPNKAAESTPSGVSQESLRRLMRLYRLEARVSQALRELMLKIDTNVACGGQIESGELTFSRELKMAHRRNQRRPVAVKSIRA